MARGHEIKIAADTRDFERGIRDGIIDPLGDGERALAELGDSAEDAGRDGARGVDKLEDALRDAQRQTESLGAAGKDAGRDVERGMKDAEDGVEELKDEANSTAREAAASFDGSAESIVDAFQEVAANAFAGFGPAGAFAGLAAAAGIGLAVKGFEDMNEAEQASEERAAEWADAYVEAGSRILDASQVVESARAIITDPEQYKQAKKNAEDWGVSESTALLAMSGDTNALAEARKALADKEAGLSGALADAGGNMRNLSHEQRENRREVQDGTASLNQLTGEMDRGDQRANVYAESLRLLADHTAGATRKVDEFGDTIVTLPDGKEIYIDAETGRATDNADAIERKIYGIRDKTVDVNVRANLGAASAAYEKWIRDHDGKSIKIKGRFITPAGEEVFG